MEKAFDIKDLGIRLKAKGLDIAEEALMEIAKETLAWTKESCAVSGNVLLLIVPPVLSAVEGSIYAAIDKLDGQVG